MPANVTFVIFVQSCHICRCLFVICIKRFYHYSYQTRLWPFLLVLILPYPSLLVCTLPLLTAKLIMLTILTVFPFSYIFSDIGRSYKAPFHSFLDFRLICFTFRSSVPETGRRNSGVFLLPIRIFFFFHCYTYCHAD